MEKCSLLLFKRKPLALMVAVTLGLSGHVVNAQESTTETLQAEAQTDDDLFEQILITASKRQTGLQETPIAVTVTTGEDIAQTQVLDIQDLNHLQY